MGDTDGKPEMKKITLSLSDETEARLRQVAEDRYGGIKGSLSIVVELALKDFFKKVESEAS